MFGTCSFHAWLMHDSHFKLLNKIIFSLMKFSVNTVVCSDFICRCSPVNIASRKLVSRDGRARSNNASPCKKLSQILLALFGRKFQQGGRQGTCITYIARLSPRRVVLMRAECESFAVKERQRRSSSNELGASLRLQPTPHLWIAS